MRFHKGLAGWAADAHCKPWDTVQLAWGVSGEQQSTE